MVLLTWDWTKLDHGQTGNGNIFLEMQTQPNKIDIIHFFSESLKLLPTITLTRVWKGDFPGIDTTNLDSDERIQIMRKRVLVTAVGFVNALLKWSLRTSAVNNFTHYRKICSNRHSANIPLELLCFLLFENKWDLLSSRIQRYILIIYALSSSKP